MTSSFLFIRRKLIGTGSGANVSGTRRPWGLNSSTERLVRAGTPLVSNTTFTPLPSVIFIIASFRSSFFGLIVYFAPKSFAIFRRSSFTSLTITVAPRFSAISQMIIPIGPAPWIKTRSPGCVLACALACAPTVYGSAVAASTGVNSFGSYLYNLFLSVTKYSSITPSI